MRGQEKVYQLPIPEEEKPTRGKSGSSSRQLSPTDLAFVRSAKKGGSSPNIQAADILGSFLNPARSHSPSDSSASLTPPLALAGPPDFTMVSDSLLTPTTSPDEESLEPWIQTV